MNTEKDTEALKGRLLQAEKSLEEFAYTVSHDLREPVRMVKSFMDLLIKRFGEGLEPKALSYVQYAVDGAGRMDIMIQDLLQYYRSVKGLQLMQVDLSIVANEAADMLRSKFGYRHPVFNIGTLPVVQGDHTGMRNVFEYIGTHLVTIVPEGENPEISIHTDKDDKIFISCKGTDLNETYLQDLFRIFFNRAQQQLENSTLNTLALAKRIVEYTGGTLQAYATDKELLVFELTMPPWNPGI